MRRIGLLILSCVILCLNTQLSAQKEDLRVLDGWLKYTDAPNALYHHFYTQAIKCLDQRSAEVAKLQSKADWQKRQEKVLNMLMDLVGPFPEKTPLNAKTVGVVQKECYRVEKIIYESRPKFYVTACMFIPNDLSEKTPAIIYCSGHSLAGFRYIAYQRVCINLVKKGFIVLAFDPVGQGERLQYYDPDIGESRVGGPTKEHSYPGAQCFISGNTYARHMIWDGIRTVDYLLSRKEVDPQRVGITGRSGGGTQSAYTAAFDDRIYAVAPECYIKSLKREFESRGPGDAEQNFYAGVARGFNNADLLQVRAPKPALMITTTRDFFSIEGARETAAEVQRAYQAFGFDENFSMVEDDAPHTSTLKNREATYAFFQKYLNLPGSSLDEEVEFLNPEESRVTQTGQVLTSLGGETIFSINKSETQKLLVDLKKSRKNLKQHLQTVRNNAQKLSGYQKPQSLNSVVFTGRFQRQGYVVEKFFMQGEGDYPIPFVLFVPKNGEQHPVVLYLHPMGKEAEAGTDKEIEWFVQKGYAVLALDLLGIGEMGLGDFTGDSYEFKLGIGAYNIWFSYILLGRSIVGLQAGDLSRLVNYLVTRADINRENITALARGVMCPVLLHAAAFNDDIKKIALIEPLVSYRSIVMNQYYKPQFILGTVAGALTAYDLPDLAASLAPRQLLMVNTKNHIGQHVEPGLIDSDLDVMRQAYSESGVKNMLSIRNWENYQGLDDLYSEWLY
jgi:cephalosporin-C deacetylase-like acetyl esterase